jgi:hypothetical protein
MKTKSTSHGSGMRSKTAVPSAEEWSSDPTGRDYLTTLPAELLSQIIADLPLRSFLDLSHTSSFLRYFIKTNASIICNDAIKTYYSREAKLLETEKRSGWLVPTHEQLRRREDFFSDLLGGYLCQDNPCEHNPANGIHCGLFGYLRGPWEIQVKITDPGPQFLFFLERGFVQRGPSYVFLGEPFYILRKEFNDFMKEFNYQVLCVTCMKGGKLATAKLSFPRELVWYYGPWKEETEENLRT